MGTSPDCSDDSGSLRSKRLVPVGEALIKQYTPLVAYIVRSLGIYFKRPHYHAGMEFSDAMQAGYEGLLKARKDFDSDKVSECVEKPFTYWATIKIRGAILDELRRNSWCGGKDKHVVIQHLGNSEGEFLADFEDEKACIEDEVAAIEYLDRLERFVNKLSPQKRNLYQGVLRHDGQGKAGGGARYCEDTRMSPQSLSYHRQRLRSQLKEALH